MLKNYFSVAVRSIFRNKFFYLIHITGLSISITAFILIFQYVHFELSYDDFPDRADDLYRLTSAYYEKNELMYHTALSIPAAGPNLKTDFREILEFTRLFPYAKYQFVCSMHYEEDESKEAFNEENLYFSDPSVFDLFSLTLIEGNQRTALQDPYSVVINISTAKRYFGNKDPIGKILTLHSSSIERRDFRVTGVMQDMPENSHLRMDILLPISFLYHAGNFGEGYLNSWSQDNLYTYVILARGTDPGNLTAKLPGFVNRHMGESLRGHLSNIIFTIQPIKSIHLHSDLQDEIRPGGDAKSVYFLSTVAVFILLIAWINYINLETARSAGKSKSIGVRRISGAGRIQIIYQMLVETFLVYVISILSAWVIIYFSFHFFQRISGVPFSFLPGLAITISVALLVGILFSGLPPAITLSNFHPNIMLTGTPAGPGGRFRLRRGLVIFQFVASVVLIIGVFIIYLQFNFMQKQKLGIDISGTLVIKAPDQSDIEFGEHLKSFKTTLRNMASVTSVATSSIIPGKENGWTGTVRKEADDEHSGKIMTFYVIDTAFIEAYQLKILAGRKFYDTEAPGKRFGDKLESVILNRKAADELGYSSLEEAINEIIYWEEIPCKMIGVVDDFHQQSLKNSLKPALFTLNNRDVVYISVKLNFSGIEERRGYESMAGIVPSIHRYWRKFFPNDPFDYFFLEDFFNLQYQADFRFGKIFVFFSTLSILIACLGLFGLTSYILVQRTKEIGIRKVFGASRKHIAIRLSGDLLKPVILSGFIAMPFAYWLAERWLQNYAYRIAVTWWMMVFPVMLVLLLSLLTTTFQTIRAASLDPSKTLRHE